jgi:hypothetical protein
MRKTAKEILAKENESERHSWLNEATVPELHEFLRLVIRPSHWADHASDALQIKLSEAVRKPHPLLWWTFGVGVIAAAASVIGYWDQIANLFRALLSLLSRLGRR